MKGLKKIWMLSNNIGEDWDCKLDYIEELCIIEANKETYYARFRAERYDSKEDATKALIEQLKESIEMSIELIRTENIFIKRLQTKLSRIKSDDITKQTICDS